MLPRKIGTHVVYNSAIVLLNRKKNCQQVPTTEVTFPKKAILLKTDAQKEPNRKIDLGFWKDYLLLHSHKKLSVNK